MVQVSAGTPYDAGQGYGEPHVFTHQGPPSSVSAGSDYDKERGDYLITQVARIAVLEALTPVVVNKGTILTKNTNTTPANVPGMKSTIATAGTYRASWYVYWQSGTTPDGKFSLAALPAGATGQYEAIFVVGGALSRAQGTLAGLAASSFVVDGLGATTPDLFEIKLVIISGGTAGDVQLTFAQNTSDASDSSVLAGSSTETIKVA